MEAEEASRIPGASYLVSAADAVKMRYSQEASAAAEKEEREREEQRRADLRWEWEQKRQQETEERRGEQDAARGAAQRAADAAEAAERERQSRQVAGEEAAEKEAPEHQHEAGDQPVEPVDQPAGEVEPAQAPPSVYSRPTYEAAEEGPSHLDRVAADQASYYGQTVADHGAVQSADADVQERQEAQEREEWLQGLERQAAAEQVKTAESTAGADDWLAKYETNAAQAPSEDSASAAEMRAQARSATAGIGGIPSSAPVVRQQDEELLP